MALKSNTLVASLLLASVAILSGESAALAARPGDDRIQLAQATQPSTVQLPSETEQVRLVDETMDIFVESMKAKSMEAFYEHASNIVRRQLTLAQVNEAFRGILELPVTGKPLEGLAPVFSGPAKQISASAFVIEGFYPTTPSNISFKITYVREGLGWKWAYINVNIAPPAKTASGPNS